MNIILRASVVCLFVVACGRAPTRDAPPPPLEPAPQSIAGDTARVDATPDDSSAGNGPPVRAETTLSAANVQAGEFVTVGCELFDAHGNRVAPAASPFTISAFDVPLTQIGLTRNDKGFSITRAGEYTVQCMAGAPLALRVEPALPFAWHVNVGPQFEECLPEGRPLPISALVFDEFNNVIKNAVLEIDSTPPLRTVSPNVFVPDVEAEYDVTLRLAGPLHPEHSIQPYALNFRVDSTPPHIVIEAPTRAAQLEQDNEVRIVAAVDDGASDVTAVEINGAAQTIQQGHAVRAEALQTGSWGLNVITAKARDACGNQRVLAQSYLLSDAYLPASEVASDASRVENGLVAYLEQRIIDDHDRSDLNDIASVAQAMLRSRDLNDTLPKPLFVYPDKDFNRDFDIGCVDCGACLFGWDCWQECGQSGVRIDLAGRMQYTLPTLQEISIDEGRLQARFSIENMVLPLYVRNKSPICVWPDLDLDGYATIRVDRGVTVSVDLNVAKQNSKAELSACPECIQIKFACRKNALNCPELDIETGLLEGSALDTLVDGGINYISSAFQHEIDKVLRAQMADALPPMLAHFIDEFKLQQALALPRPLQTQIAVNSSIDTIQLTGPKGNGSLTLGLSTQFYAPAHAALKGNTKGSIVRGGNLPVFNAALPYTFGIALKQDMLNQFLWAAWYGGAFEMPNAAEEMNLGATKVLISAKAPPVIMPGTDGFQISIGLGDLYIDGTLDMAALTNNHTPSSTPPMHAAAYISLKLSASVAIDENNVLRLTFDPNPLFYIEIVKADNMALQGQLSETFAALAKMAVPRLLAQTFSSFPIPDIDVSALTGLYPETVWTLQSPSISFSDGGDYIMLTGAL